MNAMDYEKKYNDALNLAKSYYGNGSNEFLDTIFPELAESEDERIRESIVATIKQCPYDFLYPKNRDKMLAYLERQKEQKPAEWSEEDERKRLACIDTINEVIDYERDRWEDYNPGKPYRPITKYDEQIDWLKSLRPRPSWKPSKEQMDALNYAIAEWDGGKRLEGLYALRTDLKKLGVKEEPEYYQHFDPDC